MSLLFRIIYAAHASGTHHKLVLDGLRRIGGPDAEAWRDAFLAQHKLLLEGAKAPDDEFKDFKNHVLHVRDGYWGGAPEKARNWYEHLVTALGEAKSEEAAYCLGVLSHYLTDPLMPLHTGQSEAENNVHRAIEWSVSRSYADLVALAESGGGAARVTAGTDANWLAALVCKGAEVANESYETLISHYDFHRGVVDPPAGLDAKSRRVIGGLLIRSAETVAVVLERAIVESGAKPPAVSLAVKTFLATLAIPVKAVLKRMASAAERREVEAIYDELQATGKVEVNLPEDERVMRDLYAREVQAIKAPGPSADERFPLPQAKPAVVLRPMKQSQPQAKVVARESTATAAAKSMQPRPVTPPAPPVNFSGAQARPKDEAAAKPIEAQAVMAPPRASEPQFVPPPPVDAPILAATSSISTSMPAPTPAAKPVTVIRSVPNVPLQPQSAKASTAPAPGPSAAALKAARAAAQTAAGTGKPAPQKTVVDMGSDVVDAPSIGPRTAERLVAAGIRTIGDLLAADPGVLAEELATDHIRARTVGDWQDQARLVCEIPGLRGTHAQLLTGAGFRSAKAIAEADPVRLSAAVLKFCQTSEGQRVLRSGDTPDLEKIKVWVTEAARVAAAKAA
jgi:predicted flap endonuclease-1-like 5' DNA nuclease